MIITTAPLMQNNYLDQICFRVVAADAFERASEIPHWGYIRFRMCVQSVQYCYNELQIESEAVPHE